VVEAGAAFARPASGAGCVTAEMRRTLTRLSWVLLVLVASDGLLALVDRTSGIRAPACAD